MKLQQISFDVIDWELYIEDILYFLQASSFEKDYIISLCKQAESLLFQHANIVIIPNTYKMINDCEEDATKKYTSLVLKTEFCNNLVDVNVDYVAGYDIATDTGIRYDFYGIVKGLYEGCLCDAMNYINKYKQIITIGDQDVVGEQCCC